jgi:hypothetical protein
MPKYQFEAMDSTGHEIRDFIEAPSQEEAQKTIRDMGYFVAKLSESEKPIDQENLNSMRIQKNMKNKTVQKSFATLIGLSIALLIPVLLLYGYVSVGAITYSDGTRSGVVVKVSTKGVFIKTTEGEMNYGGSLDVGGVPKVFEFSVVDPKIKDDLIDAEKQGRRCTLHYKQQLLKQFWKGQTSYFITKVEFLER